MYLHQHDEAFLDAIEDLVNEGAHVYVPRYPITIGSWRGSGYIGGGQYIISGGTGSSSPVTLSGGSGGGGSGSGSGSGGGGCSSPTVPGPSQVDLANGNYFFNETDLSVNSRGIPVVLARTYNSITKRDAGFGYGWAWTYGIRAFETPEGVVTVFRENGREDLFTPTGTSDYNNPSGVYDTLARHAGGFTLASKEGIVREFGLDGKFLSVSEPNGNTVTIQYANGLPSTVTDAAGRVALSFQTSNGHVTQVTDLYGRTVLFGYSGNDLASVTDVLGSAESFVYDAGHRLIAKTDKNGNTAYVYYDEDGRWSRSVDTEGYIRSAKIDFIAKTAKYVDANGNEEQYGWDQTVRKPCSSTARGTRSST
ncbi:MAG: RHS repeat protein [Ignavibacteriae bacterium]|nr:RHS repeat protein [Ignavibacteriota bacterium]